LRRRLVEEESKFIVLLCAIVFAQWKDYHAQGQCGEHVKEGSFNFSLAYLTFILIKGNRELWSY
jgi:hypothetical protein